MSNIIRRGNFLCAMQNHMQKTEKIYRPLHIYYFPKKLNRPILIRVPRDQGYTYSHWSKCRSHATHIEIGRFNFFWKIINVERTV